MATDRLAGGIYSPIDQTGDSARFSRRLAAWLVLAVVLVGALAFGVTDDAGPRSAGDRARNLAETIACPQCEGQSVADSDSVAAKAIRERIDAQIAELGLVVPPEDRGRSVF